MTEYGLTTRSYVIGVVLQNLDDKVEFFMNSKLEPMVRVSGDGFQQDWPADSRRFLDLLNTIYYEASQGEILRSTEREFLLSQIREKCRKGERRFTHLDVEEAEENPIVQAVLCFVNGYERFEGLTADLLEILRNSQYADRFPLAVSTFSRRLKRLIEVLRGFGVEVSLEHRKSGSHCLISRTKSFAIEPGDTLEQIDEGDDTGCVVTVSSPVNTE